MKFIGRQPSIKSDTVTFTSGNADDPAVIIENTADDNQAARLQFVKNRGAAGQDADNVAELDFYSYNDAGTPELVQYGKMAYKIDDATDGQESGNFQAWVATHNGDLRRFIQGIGGSTTNETDVTLANGAASVTTIAGTLTMGTTNTINNSGVIQVAAQTVIDHDQLANYTASEHFTQANITTVGTIGTGVWNGTAIASAYMASATDSAQGAVELATTGEADTGTDTARAVTPAGLKSHVDARYASSYITFLGQATMDSNGNWIMCNKTGISNHTWNLDSGVNTETDDSTQATIARQWAHNGIRMPAACVIAGMSCMISNASGNRQVTVGLFCSRATDSTLPDWGGNSGASPKLQMHADANNESGNYSGRPAHAEATGTVAMAAGDIFYPAIKLTGVTSGGDTDNVYASFTVHIKTLIS